MTDTVKAISRVYPLAVNGYPNIATLVIETVEVKHEAMTTKLWASYMMKEQLPFVMFDVGTENGISVHKSVPMPLQDAIEITNSFSDTFSMSEVKH